MKYAHTAHNRTVPASPPYCGSGIVYHLIMVYNKNMNSTILSWLISIGILVIYFILYKLYKKIFPNETGIIIISKEKYTVKHDCFEENTGKIIKKDDVIIKGINEHLFVFESRSGYNVPVFNGYIEINNNNVLVIYKKPMLHTIVIVLMFISMGIIYKKIILPILIVSMIYGGIALFLNIIKFNAIKSDIDYFINLGK
jgi:hypothetical protein